MRTQLAQNIPRGGGIICWDFIPHLGRTKKPCVRCDNGGKVGLRNYETACAPLKIYLAKLGVRRAHRISCGWNFIEDCEIQRNQLR